ncbi:hypothetical protein PVK06_041686 [Gossypium arboreum]|uniref:Uncharacterized protein n=1 Tax=Gossypium arboreum TaxID=29729 RepID=A0ABR0NB21_GOSAR|nr:hypothetical protein PVK06_041686 [Gossypium arboreum]
MRTPTPTRTRGLPGLIRNTQYNCCKFTTTLAFEAAISPNILNLDHKSLKKHLNDENLQLNFTHYKTQKTVIVNGGMVLFLSLINSSFDPPGNSRALIIELNSSGNEATLSKYDITLDMLGLAAATGCEQSNPSFHTNSTSCITNLFPNLPSTTAKCLLYHSNPLPSQRERFHLAVLEL